MHLTLLPVPGFLRSASSAQLPAGVPGRGAAALLLPAEGPRPLPPRLRASGRAEPGGPCGLPLAAGSPRSLRGGPGGRGSGSAFASSAGRAAEAPRAAAPPAALRHMARCGGGGSAPRGPGPGAAERQRLREALAEQLRRDVGRWARGEARRRGGGNGAGNGTGVLLQAAGGGDALRRDAAGGRRGAAGAQGRAAGQGAAALRPAGQPPGGAAAARRGTGRAPALLAVSARPRRAGLPALPAALPEPPASARLCKVRAGFGMGPGGKLHKPGMRPLNRLRLVAPPRTALPAGNRDGSAAQGCPARHSALGRQSREHCGGQLLVRGPVCGAVPAVGSDGASHQAAKPWAGTSGVLVLLH